MRLLTNGAYAAVCVRAHRRDDMHILQHIERAHDMGIWIKDLKRLTGLQQVRFPFVHVAPACGLLELATRRLPFASSRRLSMIPSLLRRATHSKR